MRIPVRPEGTLWGLIDASGELVVAPRFTSLGEFAEGLALASSPTEGYGFVDEAGEWAVPPGTVELGPYAGPFSEGLARVQVKGLWGYVDARGAWVIEPQYHRAEAFAEGLASVRKGEGEYGWIDRENREVIPCTFAGGDTFYEGRARAVLPKQSGWSYIDRAGKVVIPGPYASAASASEGRIGFLCPTTKSWGYIDLDGGVAVPPAFGMANPFNEGLAVVRPSGGEFGAIDPSGKFVIAPRFRELGPFKDGVARASARGGWGYVDTQGEWVIGPQLADARDFEGGRARVSFEGVQLTAPPAPPPQGLKDAAKDNPLLGAIVRNMGKDPFKNGNFGVIDRAGAVVWPRGRGLALRGLDELEVAEEPTTASPQTAAELHEQVEAATERSEALATRQEALTALTWAKALQTPALWASVVVGVVFGWFHGADALYSLTDRFLPLPVTLVFAALGLGWGRMLAGLVIEAGGLGAAALHPGSVLGAVAAAAVGALFYAPFDPLELTSHLSPIPLVAYGLLGLWIGRVGGFLWDDLTPESRRALGVALGGWCVVSLGVALFTAFVVEKSVPPQVLLMLAGMGSAFAGLLWLMFAKPRRGVQRDLSYFAAILPGDDRVGFGSEEAEARERLKQRGLHKGFVGVCAAIAINLLLALLPWAALALGTSLPVLDRF